MSLSMTSASKPMSTSSARRSSSFVNVLGAATVVWAFEDDLSAMRAGIVWAFEDDPSAMRVGLIWAFEDDASSGKAGFDWRLEVNGRWNEYLDLRDLREGGSPPVGETWVALASALAFAFLSALGGTGADEWSQSFCNCNNKSSMHTEEGEEDLAGHGQGGKKRETVQTRQRFAS